MQITGISNATLHTVSGTDITPGCSYVHVPTPSPMHIQSKIANSQAQSNSVDTLLVSTQELFVNVHMVNALLGKLKCGKENSVDHARARHGNTQACRR